MFNNQKSEITLKIEGKSYKPYAFILCVILATLMQVLSSSGNDTSQAIVTLYFSIVLLTLSIYKIGFYGVIAAGISSALFLFSIHQEPAAFFTVVLANTVQAVLIYSAFKIFRFSARSDSAIGTTTLLSFIAGTAYVLFSFLHNEYYTVGSSVILVFLVCIYIIDFFKKRDGQLLKFALFVVLIPNFTGATIGSLQDMPLTEINIYWDNFFRWFFSNVILMLSFGYPLFKIINQKSKQSKTSTYLLVKFSTALFYISVVLWNLIIFSLYYVGWLNKNTNSFFFPWLVGNLFFLANLYFSTFDEKLGKTSEKFQWYENRSVATENNTQMLVAIISFLLPICAQLLGTISHSISVLFIFNITSAIVSIGLIWIPEDHVRYMSAIKHLKTAFHLFTLSLLLLNIILIINESTTP
ncbi:MAG: hypothetical protein E7516_09030 [Ruminococcaceae bacterium]|nr:hypothetical protein [Oscillospiraceae bacterium]